MTPTRTVINLQHFSEATPAVAAKLRGDAAALAKFQADPNVARNGIGMYWHAVPYLLTGLAKDQDEPYCFFMKGGETLGANDVGDIRYLSPAQVTSLAEMLAEEEPDELGLGTWDDAKMDQLGIHPCDWVSRSSSSDHLGTARELYSYVQEFTADVKKRQNGLVIHFTQETQEYDDEADDGNAAALAARAAQPPPPKPTGKVIHRGAGDRTYHEADAAKDTKVKAADLKARDAVMERTGMRHVGDFKAPDDPTDVLRAYVSEDRTVCAILYLTAERIGRYRFYSRLNDALVVSSDAFIVQMKKFGFHADFLQDQEPDKLLAAVIAKRKKLEKKHGAPQPFEPTAAVVAGAWEEQYARCSKAEPK